jgi:transposase
MDLTDKQWEIVEALLPKRRVRKDGKGRPPKPDRDVLNGILWILRTGAQWEDLPDRYPSRSTCHRRFQQWSRDGTLKKIRAALLKDLDQRGKIDWEESFIDGSFAAAKKGGPPSAKLSVAKARSGWQLSTATAFHWELPSTAPPRPRSSSPKSRSKTSRARKSPSE